jgi:uncharacterized protein (TIGR02118 family)
VIRVTGFYRWTDGASFDHEYYNSAHMALTREQLLPLGLVRLESDRFISGTAPKPGEIVAASHAYFRDIAQAQAALASAGKVLMSDVPKYTTLVPEIRMSVVTSHLEARDA